MHRNPYARAAGLVLASVVLVAFLCAQGDSTPPGVQWVYVSIAPSASECRDGSGYPPVLVVHEDSSMILTGDKLTFGQIRPVFNRIMRTRSDKRVFLKASGRLRYGAITRILGELHSVPELQVVLLTPELELAPCAPPIPRSW